MHEMIVDEGLKARDRVLETLLGIVATECTQRVSDRIAVMTNDLDIDLPGIGGYTGTIVSTAGYPARGGWSDIELREMAMMWTLSIIDLEASDYVAHKCARIVGGLVSECVDCGMCLLVTLDRVLSTRIRRMVTREYTPGPEEAVPFSARALRARIARNLPLLPAPGTARKSDRVAPVTTDHNNKQGDRYAIS